MVAVDEADTSTWELVDCTTASVLEVVCTWLVCATLDDDDSVNGAASELEDCEATLDEYVVSSVLCAAWKLEDCEAT